LKVLILTAEGFEDRELLYPYTRLKEEGIEVKIASNNTGTINGIHGYSVDVDCVFDNVNPKEFDVLFLPGGKAPQKIRQNEKVLEITRYFIDNDKPVAAICHGPQILVSADVLNGRRATSYSSVRKELASAGAEIVDEEVVKDGNKTVPKL
jgi:protease I